MSRRTGRCMCGAVSFAAEIDEPRVSACHCGMCRQWAGGPYLAVHATGEVAFKGAEQIGVYRASEWGERGFCKRCGSNLFWRMQDGSDMGLAAGAFDDPQGLQMKLQYFIDQRPAFYSFEQQTKTLTGAEIEALFGGDASTVGDAP